MNNNQLLFTTEDGVDIYPGDKYFSVKVEHYTPHIKHAKLPHIPLGSIAGPYINPKAHEPSGSIKHFSTKQVAYDYVREMRNKLRDKYEKESEHTTRQLLLAQIKEIDKAIEKYERESN